LLAAVSIPEASFDENGVTYYAVKIPNEKSMKLTYAFVDGYWIVGSNPEEVSSAVKLHGSGKSLAKDARFLEAVPPGFSAEASGLFYQNPVAIAGAQMKQLGTEMADVFLRAAREIKPSVGFAYGDESAIRMASVSGSADVTTALVVAAIAIPNLLRSKMAANEASAVGTLRTLNTAQVTYATMYPKRGYAPNIITFGPDARDSSSETPEHANLVDSSLAGENCATDGWCTKTGYQFKATARCRAHLCDDYVVVATPVSENTGTRSFCATSTGIIHWQSGGPLTAPLSIAKCNEWAPIQ
jgi:type II secretory pathway pseudopilin PulG